MKRSLVWVVPLLLLVICVWARSYDPPIVQDMRMWVFDELQRQFPARWEDTDVRIVDIDDDSLARMGQWPWPRTVVADMVNRLVEGGAAAVAFDVVFAEPDRTSPAIVLPLWGNNPELNRMIERLPDHDSILAGVFARGRVVVGFSLLPELTPNARPPIIRAGFATLGDATSVDPRPYLMRFNGVASNLVAFDVAAAGQGNFTTGFERDGVVRRVPLVSVLRRPDGPGMLVPSLAVEALRVAQGVPGYLITSVGGGGEIGFGEHTGVVSVRLGDVIVPTDSMARVWLRDTGPVPQRFVPAWRILAGEVPPEEIDGRIFFVGTSAPGLRDLRATPLDPTAAGVTIHARITEQMLRGDYLTRPDWMTGGEIIWLAAFGLMIIVVLPLGGPFIAAAIALVGAGSPFAFAGWYMTSYGNLVDPVFPAAVVLLIYLTQSLIIFSQREAERRQVRSAFSRYLSPTVVETLAQHPERLQLGGEMRELTIMFSDIRGFTSRSERMQAQELTQFLNRFLTPMTDCILARGGTIDKYMGDAVMAFWNAPLDEPQHPVDAARAGLEMIATLGRLNEQWAAEAAAANQPFEPVAIGVGLNLGMACVGNMGSQQRFDYSIIGDAVNLASRLEGLSKTYGVPIIVGEDLARRIEGFALVPLDRAKVRGKQQRVRIYTLLGDE
ncbi:MAG: adenylate/guanylate cyclase domain-containing protein, partial [Alphaproteobacteria bacterium]|nr:adenylate/guanylate cyclase domain-containing protein [Alphaproteobacteria bacterium]